MFNGKGNLVGNCPPSSVAPGDYFWEPKILHTRDSVFYLLSISYQDHVYLWVSIFGSKNKGKNYQATLSVKSENEEITYKVPSIYHVNTGEWRAHKKQLCF